MRMMRLRETCLDNSPELTKTSQIRENREMTGRESTCFQ